MSGAGTHVRMIRSGSPGSSIRAPFSIRSVIAGSRP